MDAFSSAVKYGLNCLCEAIANPAHDVAKLAEVARVARELEQSSDRDSLLSGLPPQPAPVDFCGVKRARERITTWAWRFFVELPRRSTPSAEWMRSAR